MTQQNDAGSGTAAHPDESAGHRTLSARVRTAFADVLDHDTTDTLEAKSANELADIRTELALSRNLMAADRTLMAWIRTALSLNSFGFTIYKLLEAYQASGVNLPHSQTPRNLGLFLTGMGTFAMVMGAVEYWGTIKELRQLKSITLARPTFIMGILMACMGIFLFFGIIAHLF